MLALVLGRRNEWVLMMKDLRGNGRTKKADWSLSTPGVRPNEVYSLIIVTYRWSWGQAGPVPVGR